jgi:TRAP-type C4-dicarboxylate transport system substrate-binding protein
MNKVVNIIAVSVFTLLFCSGIDARTLKFATLAPAGTSWMNEITAGADRVEQRTSGRVKLKFYPGGVMGNDQSVYRKIKIGQLHGGAFPQSGLGQINTNAQALGMPMMFRNLEEVDYVRKRLDPVIKREMESSGFILLGISGGGFAHILSKQPMQDLEALRASKVWIPEGDQVGLTAFRALGITPILLPISDVFTGLQTGLIETVPVNPTSAIAFQWHSNASYMTDIPISFLTGSLALAKPEFDKLTAEDQAILLEEMGAVFRRIDEQGRQDNEAATQALKQQGITFVSPSPGETERWREIARQAVDDMVSSGVISAEIVEQIRKDLQIFRAQQ